MEQTNAHTPQAPVSTNQPQTEAVTSEQQEPLNLGMSQASKALLNERLATTQRQAIVREYGKNYGNQSVLRLLHQVTSSSRTQQVQRQVIQRFVEENSAQRIINFINSASVAELRTLITNFDAASSTGDHIGVELPAPINQTVSVATADATELRSQTVTRLTQHLMEDLANGRRTLAETMNNAPDEAARRTTMVALHDFDTPLLTELRQLTAGHTNRWQYPDGSQQNGVQDGVLAAIQLDAVFNAESSLDNPTNAHKDAANSAGMGEDLEWCGFFVAHNYLAANLGRDLRQGFFATENVVDFFNYNYGDRVKKWIFADNQWQQLRAYHEGRQSLRTWIDAHGLQASDLDIRPGDVVLVDWHGSDRPDHIQMVHSYNPQSRELFYIDGNGGGFVVDTHARNAATAQHESHEQSETEAATGRNLTNATTAGGHVGVGMHDLNNQPDPDAVHRNPDKNRHHVRVFGIGRPSIVDFEDHYYDAHSAMPKIPPRQHH